MHGEEDIPLETIGHVTAPSGKLLIIDPGLLNLWSHDRPVRAEPSGLVSDEICDIANSAVDLRIDGPDAEQAGRAFNRQWHNRFIYDIPAKRVEEVISPFEMKVHELNLNAKLVPMPDRMRHRNRIDRTFEQSPCGGIVQYHGVNAIVVGRVPDTCKLDIVGWRMPPGKFSERWKQVSLEFSAGESVSAELLGRVGVEEAKLLFADVEAMAFWKNDELIDGLANFLFWGRDAAQVAVKFGAPRRSGTEWGWINLPIEEIVPIAEPIEACREQGLLKFATDFRPHTDFHRLRSQIRSTPEASGTINVGGAEICGFHTSWGDGHFPVYLDRDSAGNALRVRVELGTDETVERQMEMERKYRK